MAGSRGQDRGQYEDSEWNAAVELVGLSTPVVVDSRTPAAAAAAGSERNAAVELVGLSTPVVVDSPDPAAAAAADSEWDAAIELGSLSNPVVVDSPTPAAAAAADSEWNAAIELVGLSTPVVVDSTAPAAAAAADSERNAAIELGSLSNPVVVDSPTPAASTVAAASSEVSAKSEEVKIKSNGSGKAKAFKKPDTIVPCARCNSMETKFCYFNNCNENQPRHFCRACKRYWTVGGAMRDVPESSGRRWNKQSSSHRNATKPANGDVPDIPHRGSHTAKPPMAYTQFSTDGIRGLENSDTRIMISRLPLLPPMMSVPRIREPDVPFPQVSPSWSCTPGSTGTTLPSLPPSRVVGPSGRDSLTQGKHPREGNSQEDEKGEKTFWVPKVLRAADPEEAVKSSIWDSLGIKPDQRLFWKCKCKCRQSRF